MLLSFFSVQFYSSIILFFCNLLFSYYFADYSVNYKSIDFILYIFKVFTSHFTNLMNIPHWGPESGSGLSSAVFYDSINEVISRNL